MTPSDINTALDFEPVARGALAAAGPVEPSLSPDMAPGPTLSSPQRKSRAYYFRSRKTQALVNQGRALYRRGETYSAIARALGITPDTARRWLDPDYDAKRRSRAIHLAAKADGTTTDDPVLPTLVFVPGITISGRYRMNPSDNPIAEIAKGDADESRTQAQAGPSLRFGRQDEDRAPG